MLDFILFFICPMIFMLTICYLFVVDDSKYQKYRLRCSLDEIWCYIKNNTKSGTPYCSVDVIYKNKEFSIGVILEEINYHYKKYRIFINGDEVAEYHSLLHTFFNSYEFCTIKRRHKDEIISIVHAGYRKLKDAKKATTEKSSWDEQSYFK